MIYRNIKGEIYRSGGLPAIEWVVLDNPKTSPESELRADIISIITIFSTRLHGLRSPSIRKKIREAIKNDEVSPTSNIGREEVSGNADGEVQMVLSSLTVLNLEAIRTGKKLEDNHSFTYPFLRDHIVKKYKYTEEQIDNILFCDYVYDDENTEMMSPEWMTGIHSRLQRGAIQKLSENINSALSNKRAGHINNFNLKMLSTKSPTEFIHFEDQNFPTTIKGIDSRFWFTDKARKR